MKHQDMLRQVLLAATFLYSAKGLILPTLVNCGVRQDVNCTDICTSTTIIFYSGNNETSYELNAAGAKLLLANPYFSKSKETNIFQHGYTRSPSFSGAQAIKNAFIAKSPPVNYLAVNASECFAGTLVNVVKYQAAATKTPCIGRLIAEFLKTLKKGGLASDNMRLIGHSLGGPTMSSAAKFYRKATNETIYRLTALDSAGPCFGSTTTNQPQPGDAKCVDAIHTNTLGFGSSATLGDADFYPNGGRRQPGCILNPDIHPCSHEIVAFYYAETVNSQECIAAKYTQRRLTRGIQRNSTAIMGYHWQHEKGNYYLETNSKPLFCLGPSGY